MKLRLARFLRRRRRQLPSLIHSWIPAWHLELGRFGETLASRVLQELGFHIWITNWKCRAGELDIIAYRGHQMIVVEVKTRTAATANRYPGTSAVDPQRIKRLISATNLFLRSERRERKARRLWRVRFDVIDIVVCPHRLEIQSLRHFEDAFSTDGVDLG